MGVLINNTSISNILYIVHVYRISIMHYYVFFSLLDTSITSCVHYAMTYRSVAP